MIIAINGETFAIKPNQDEWLVKRRWKTFRSNTAGIEWLCNYFLRETQLTDTQRAFRRQECEYGFGFRCPHYGKRPCTANRKTGRIAIQYSNYKLEWRPIGQMSLFAPDRTHAPWWVNVNTGHAIQQTEQPFATACIMCQEMAQAGMEYMKNKEGWKPLLWMLTPLKNPDKARRYSNKEYKPCTIL